MVAECGIIRGELDISTNLDDYRWLTGEDGRAWLDLATDSRLCAAMRLGVESVDNPNVVKQRSSKNLS